MSLEIGLKGRAETLVVESNTAAAVGSGLVPVFATPYMIALMENSAVNAVNDHLDAGQGTVGTHLNVSHEAATPIGMKVWAEAILTEADGKRLVFEVTAYDEAGVIGRGSHERFIINTEKFRAKCEAKKQK